MLPFLDRNSNPPGYSSRAANAAIAAAQSGKFVQYYSSLYTAQPKEGAAGYTDSQLLQLGRDLGLGLEFSQAVNNQSYANAVQGDFQQVLATVGQDLYHGSFQTPTVTHDGQLVNYHSDGQPIDWLGPLIDTGG